MENKAGLHRSVHNRSVDGYRRANVLDVVPLYELDEAGHGTFLDLYGAPRNAMLTVKYRY